MGVHQAAEGNNSFFSEAFWTEDLFSAVKGADASLFCPDLGLGPQVSPARDLLQLLPLTHRAKWLQSTKIMEILALQHLTKSPGLGHPGLKVQELEGDYLPDSLLTCCLILGKTIIFFAIVDSE